MYGRLHSQIGDFWLSNLWSWSVNWWLSSLTACWNLACISMIQRGWGVEWSLHRLSAKEVIWIDMESWREILGCRVLWRELKRLVLLCWGCFECGGGCVVGWRRNYIFRPIMGFTYIGPPFVGDQPALTFEIPLIIWYTVCNKLIY